MAFSGWSETVNSFPLSVVMVCDSFYPTYSGAGRQALALSKALVARGHNITLLARWIADAPLDEVIEGVRIQRIPVKNGSSRLGNLLSQILFALSCWRWIRRYAPNAIVHVHGLALWSMLLLILLGRRQPTLAKMSLQGVDDAETLSRGRFARLFKWAVASASGIISISPALSESYRRARLPLDKLIEIPNGVDTAHFCPVSSAEEKRKLRQILGLPVEGRFIVFVGAISERKGVKQLFDAWLLLAATHDDVHLLLVGPWNKRPSDEAIYLQLKQSAEKNLVTDRVHFVGQVDDVAPYLRASDLFVLPSRSEGMPNSLLEAMACGLPCCVSLLSGITDLLIRDGEDGYLFALESTGEPCSFKDILETILGMPQSNDIGKKARAEIVRWYSFDVVVARYEKYYRSLAEERNRVCLSDSR